jgi:hypothetical protein
LTEDGEKRDLARGERTRGRKSEIFSFEGIALHNRFCVVSVYLSVSSHLYGKDPYHYTAYFPSGRMDISLVLFVLNLTISRASCFFGVPWLMIMFTPRLSL